MRRRRAREGAAYARLVLNAHRRPRTRGSPLVSVVIATFNWSSVLRHAVASALSQEYPSLEVIVIGDCCTDDSEEVVASVGDARVRWENLPRNSGSQSAPNNRGLELAHGKYVAYLGHDDLWLPGHLAHLVAAAERMDAGIATSALEAVGPHGSGHRVIVGAQAGERDWVPPTSVLHRRDLVDRVGGWREWRTMLEPPDREFVERLAMESGWAQSFTLTAIKFSSAWRRNSYITKRDDEQTAYAERIRTEHFFVEREIAACVRLRLRGRPPILPVVDELPDVIPPGWYVGQWRRIRGLPEMSLDPFGDDPDLEREATP